jgi:hypothetical protein
MPRAEQAAYVGKIRNPYKILVGKPEGKKQFGRTGNGWEGNRPIKSRS